MWVNQEISLETGLPLQSVQGFTLDWGLNRHAVLAFQGTLGSNCGDSVWRQCHVGTEIKVALSGSLGAGGDSVLFRGPVRGAKLARNHGVGTVEVEAVSASTMLDSQKVCRTFQDPSLSYGDVAKQMAGAGPGAVICTTEKKAIGKPVACYQETTWGFLKRMAGRQGGFLVPDIKTGRPNLWFGMRQGKEIEGGFGGRETSVGVHKEYGRDGKGRAVTTHCLECRASHSLGDWVLEQGEKLVIYGAHARFERGDISFSYKLAAARDLKKEASQDSRFTGLGLWGKVDEAKGESVRVTFDMDGKEGRWFYPWRPETGNALYAVPEVGARVAVCFPDGDAGEAVAVRCMGGAEGNQAPADKSMAIPEDGKIGLFTGSLEAKKNGETMAFGDSSGIGFSGGQIEIEASGKVRFRAKRIKLSAGSEIKATTQ